MKNTYLMKKAMIETAVSHGIHQISEDPERSIRRLVDLGKQFSKNRFQETVFSVMQEVLDNENSAYYDMMHNLIKNSDEDAMRKFGVNFGYMSWTYGAGRIREEEKQSGYCIPWTILLRYDANSSEGFTAEELAHLMEQGQELGIYAYFIRETGAGTDSYDLLDLLERYKDCAFVWIRQNGRLTAAQIQMLKVCQNTVVSLPVEDPESLLTAALLRDQTIIFALHAVYDDSFSEEAASHVMESVLASETSLFFLIAKDGTLHSAASYCYRSRLEQNYPCVMMDYYGDCENISRVLTEHTNLLELTEDKHVLRPDAGKGMLFPTDVPLKEALRRIMPGKDSPDGK